MTLPFLLDPGLIQKYDTQGQGPVFPPLALFREQFREATYREQIDVSNGDPIPRQLAVNLVLPASQSSSKLESATSRTTDDALACLAREIVIKGRLFDSDRQVMQLHISGGIPAGGTEVLAELLTILDCHFNLSATVERVLSVELAQLTPALLARLADLNFNRLKIHCGIEGAAGSASAAAICATARSYGIAAIEMHVAYGVEGQSTTSVQAVLSSVLAGGPDQVCLWRYPSNSRLGEAGAGHPQASVFLTLAVEQLLTAGYSSVGCKTFVPGAVVGANLTPGLDYCTHCSMDWVGLGPGSLSRAGDSYFINERRQAGYCGALKRGDLPVGRGLVLSASQLVRRDLINALSCHGGLDLEAFEQRHGIVFSVAFARELAALQGLVRDGLLSITDRKLTLSPLGKLLFTSVSQAFEGKPDSNIVDLAPTRAWQQARVPQ